MYVEKKVILKEAGQSRRCSLRGKARVTRSKFGKSGKVSIKNLADENLTILNDEDEEGYELIQKFVEFRFFN